MDALSVHVLGDLMVDIAFGVSSLEALTSARGSDFPSPATLSPGGSAANTATWLARCGVNVSLIGAVGADPMGDYLIREIASSQVHILLQRVPNELTGICLILNEHNGERTMIPSSGANAQFSDTHLHDLLATTHVTHVHISAYMLFHEVSGSTALDYLAAARRAGASISLDPASSALLAPNRERLIAAMGMCDLLLSNADEAREITRLLIGDNNMKNDCDLDLISTALYPSSPTVVVTDGSQPVRAQSDYVHNFTSPVPTIQKLTSSTGAGDAFNAGFLNAWLAGREIPASIAAGTILASGVLGQVGATTLTGEQVPG